MAKENAQEERSKLEPPIRSSKADERVTIITKQLIVNEWRTKHRFSGGGGRE